MRPHASEFRTGGYVPESPEALDTLPAFDPLRRTIVAEYPVELRLDAAIVDLLEIVEEQAELAQDAPLLTPAFCAAEVSRLMEARRLAIAAVRREALREARRSAGLRSRSSVDVSGELARAAADTVRRTFERDPETDPETIEAMAREAAVRAALNNAD